MNKYQDRLTNSCSLGVVHGAGMSGQPTYRTARRRLETEREPHAEDAVSVLLTDGWGVYAIWSGPYECLYVGESAEGESVKKRLLDHLSRQEPNRDL